MLVFKYMDLKFVLASWPIKYLTKKNIYIYIYIYKLSLNFEHETKAIHDWTTQSIHTNLSKIQKVSKFAQFSSKTTHIIGCKNVHIYTFATLTMQICMVTVALYNNSLFIYLFFLSHHLGSLSFPMATATQQRKRRQISNHQLGTTQPFPPQPISAVYNPPQN